MSMWPLSVSLRRDIDCTFPSSDFMGTFATSEQPGTPLNFDNKILVFAEYRSLWGKQQQDTKWHTLNQDKLANLVNDNQN